MTDGSAVVWSSEDDEKTQEGVADWYADGDWEDDYGTLVCGCCSCCGCLCEPWENDDTPGGL